MMQSLVFYRVGDLERKPLLYRQSFLAHKTNRLMIVTVNAELEHVIDTEDKFEPWNPELCNQDLASLGQKHR